MLNVLNISAVQGAKMLGWTSIGIGVLEIAGTCHVERVMGVKHHHTLLRVFGAREIGAGVTILSQPGLNKTMVAGMWSRVAGDVADLAMLGSAWGESRNRTGLLATIGTVLAVTALDVMVAVGLQKELVKSKRVSQAAKARVKPTAARPDGEQARAGSMSGGRLGGA